MSTYWIIGGGKFGLKAVEDLSQAHPAADFILVEKETEICQKLSELGFEVACMDGIDYLALHLKRQAYPDWIVPAIPIHVAFEWIKIQLSKKYDLQPVLLPQKIVKTLPNPIKLEDGQLFTSNADFICPQDCPEPDDICMFTGKPRPRILHDFLSKIEFDDFQTVVIRSQQLSPGVGGYRPLDLFYALDKIESNSKPVILSTACRCHGVMNAFQFSAKHNS
jgi:hypothetical protein